MNIIFISFVTLSLVLSCFACNGVDSGSVRRALRSFTDFGDLIGIEDMDLNIQMPTVPGTKWCGAGNTAANFDDLGWEWRTDMCCRDHDHCPDFIAAGETRYNLTNDVFYTRLNCECDEAFRRCLRRANTTSSNNIGVVYFDALATKCFRVDYPKLSCKKRGGWLNRKCLEHRYNTSAAQVYQWFDVANY